MSVAIACHPMYGTYHLHHSQKIVETSPPELDEYEVN